MAMDSSANKFSGVESLDESHFVELESDLFFFLLFLLH